MERGVCPKCQSLGQRFYDFDKAAKGRRLVCFQCGYVTHWVNVKDGRVYNPPPWVPELSLDYEHEADPGRVLDLIAYSDWS
jgi:hypothetical protein